MSSRDDILQAIRRNKPGAVPLPPLPERPAPADDLIAPFTAALEAAGGLVVAVSPGASLADAFAARYPDAAVVCSAVPDAVPGTCTPHDVDDPHTLAGVDVFVCEGSPGVAENGAVWVDEIRLVHRAAPFLAQHLALIVDAASIVATMHDAYARLSVDAAGYGVFIAGPSKTADIEQSLVIGAHGPRSLTVFLREGE